MFAPRLALHGGLALLTGLVLACACSSAPQNLGGAQCTYGQVIGCQGPGKCQGVQQCLPDLSGFTACECGDAAATDAAQDAFRGPG